MCASALDRFKGFLCRLFFEVVHELLKADDVVQDGAVIFTEVVIESLISRTDADAFDLGWNRQHKSRYASLISDSFC